MQPIRVTIVPVRSSGVTPDSPTRIRYRSITDRHPNVMWITCASGAGQRSGGTTVPWGRYLAAAITATLVFASIDTTWAVADGDMPPAQLHQIGVMAVGLAWILAAGAYIGNRVLDQLGETLERGIEIGYRHRDDRDAGVSSIRRGD